MSYFNKICEFVHNHFFLSAYSVIEEICRQIYVLQSICVCVYIDLLVIYISRIINLLTTSKFGALTVLIAMQ
jgi:hypothetical protein